MMASLRGSVCTGTEEVESSTGRVWASGFHHVTARSPLGCVLKLKKIYFLIFQFFSDSSKPRTTETADTESADTWVRLYLEILECGTPENKYVGN
jgi:hypothetical protein